MRRDRRSSRPVSYLMVRFPQRIEHIQLEKVSGYPLLPPSTASAISYLRHTMPYYFQAPQPPPPLTTSRSIGESEDDSTLRIGGVEFTGRHGSGVLRRSSMLCDRTRSTSTAWSCPALPACQRSLGRDHGLLVYSRWKRLVYSDIRGSFIFTISFCHSQQGVF